MFSTVLRKTYGNRAPVSWSFFLLVLDVVLTECDDTAIRESREKAKKIIKVSAQVTFSMPRSAWELTSFRVLDMTNQCHYCYLAISQALSYL